MMNIKQRFIYKASIGFSLGVLVTIIINIISAYVQNGDMMYYLYDFKDVRSGRTFMQLMLELLTGGLLGLIGNGGSVVYEIESWGILKSTIVHFLFTMTTFFVIGLFNGWLIPGINLTNIVMISAMILAYFIIWLVQYLVYKKEIDDINKGVKLLKSREDS